MYTYNLDSASVISSFKVSEQLDKLTAGGKLDGVIITTHPCPFLKVRLTCTETANITVNKPVIPGQIYQWVSHKDTHTVIMHEWCLYPTPGNMHEFVFSWSLSKMCPENVYSDSSGTFDYWNINTSLVIEIPPTEHVIRIPISIVMNPKSCKSTKTVKPFVNTKVSLFNHQCQLQFMCMANRGYINLAVTTEIESNPPNTTLNFIRGNSYNVSCILSAHNIGKSKLKNIQLTVTEVIHYRAGADDTDDAITEFTTTITPSGVCKTSTTEVLSFTLPKMSFTLPKTLHHSYLGTLIQIQHYITIQLNTSFGTNNPNSCKQINVL